MSRQYGNAPRRLGKHRPNPCTCEPWAADEACPVHGDRTPQGPGTCCWAQAPDGPKPCVAALCSRTEPPRP